MKRTKPPIGKPDKPTGNITLSKALRDKMFETRNGDSLILYLFYRHTADWQCTDQPKANDKYCMKALGWGYSRFIKAKNILIEISLIRQVTRRDSSGKVNAWYIKVNHTWEGEIPHNTENSVVVENGLTAPQLRKTSTSKQKTNTLKTNKNDFLYFISFFSDEWKNTRPFRKAILDFVKYRNQKNKLTPKAIKLLAEDFKKQSNTQIVINAINKTIMNNYKGVFFSDPISKYKCYISKWTFGKSFNPSLAGCRDCEEDNSKLYKECRLAHQSLKTGS